MEYFNTTKEDSVQTQIFSDKNKTQNDIIKSIIEKLDKPFSPAIIYKMYPVINTPLTSIRRSLSTLKKEGYIVETGKKVLGLFGRNELELKKA